MPCRLLLPLLVAALFSAATLAAATQDPADTWFTGPLLATNPVAAAQGHLLIEPYLLWTHSDGSYDRHGHRHGEARHSRWSSSIPMYYGITERLTGELALHGARSYDRQGNGTGMRLGDLDARLSYQLAGGDAQRHRPTIGISLTRRFATGRYDRLGAASGNGIGQGVGITSLALNTQTLWWTAGGHILRVRGDLSLSLPDRRATVDGTSVYGTGEGFHGHARPGNSWQADLGLEYSINPRWALAGDVLYSHSGRARIFGRQRGDVAVHELARSYSHALELAPALEYHWSRRIGLIGGVQFTVAGRNTSARVVPQLALNMLF